jgi:hypothetical protein
MQHQRSEPETWLPNADETARVVLPILIGRYPALVAVEELVRELSEPSLLRPIQAPDAHDALADLVTGSIGSSSRR